MGCETTPLKYPILHFPCETSSAHLSPPSLSPLYLSPPPSQPSSTSHPPSPTHTGTGCDMFGCAGVYGRCECCLLTVGGVVYGVLGGVGVCDGDHGDQRHMDLGGVSHVEHSPSTQGMGLCACMYKSCPCIKCLSMYELQHANNHNMQAAPRSEARMSAYAPTELEMQLWPQDEESNADSPVPVADP